MMMRIALLGAVLFAPFCQPSHCVAQATAVPGTPAASDVPLAPRAAPQPTLSLTGHDWVLRALNGGEVHPEAPATLRFATDNTVDGNDGCNQIRGTYVATADTLTMAPPMTTRMMCSPERMRLATRVNAALAATTGYTLRGQELTLLDAASKPLARYGSAPARGLTAAPWVATQISANDAAAKNVLKGTTITALFAADGTLSGEAGCNHYTTTYHVRGIHVAVSPPAVTEKSCADDVMAQERAYLAALTSATGLRFGDETLALRGSTGQLLVSFAVRADP